MVVPVRGLRLDIERFTYTTVVLMSVLVVYDGWADLASFVGVALVIIAPVLAISLADGFSEALHEMALAGRPLTGKEWRELIRGLAHVLAAAIPPLAVLAVGWLSPWDVRSTIVALLWTGTLTLVALAYVTARRTGLHGWRVIVASGFGGIIGLIVISLQILLKPH